MGAASTATATAAASTSTSGKELTKRQRRKHPNPSNTWQQQPRIKTSEARAKAHVRNAGLVAVEAQEKELLDPSLDLHSPELRFGRVLAGSDQKGRHAAVAKLRAYLKARCDIHNENGGISELDLMKLWKALWHTLYMADKVPVQDELSKRLTELIWCLAGTEEEDEYAGQAYLDVFEEGVMEQQQDCQEDDDDDVVMEEMVNTTLQHYNDDDTDESDDGSSTESDNEAIVFREEDQNDDDASSDDDDGQSKHCRGAHLAALFVRTFFRTVRREWGNMDKYRVDKFYTLVRLMISQVYKYMAVRHWNIGIIRLFNDTIFEEVLAHTPNGLRYHLIDITMEELAKVNAKNAPMPLTEATFLDCLEPYFFVAQSVQDGLVHKRVMENVVLKFLEEFSIVSSSDAAAALQSNDDTTDRRDDDEDEKRLLVMDQVRVSSVAQFIFELASDSRTDGKYRKELYTMHKVYMRRIKQHGKDVEFDEENEEDSSSHEEGVLFPVIGDEHEAGLVGAEASEEGEKLPNEKESKASENKEKEEATELLRLEGADNGAEKTKKSDKRRKKKKKRRSSEGSGKEANLGAEHGHSAASPSISTSAESNEGPVSTEGSTTTGGKSEMGKADTALRRQQKKEQGQKRSKLAEDDEDEVITISFSEQKVAKSAASLTANDEVVASSTKTSKKEGKKSRKQRSTPSVDPHAMANSDGIMSDTESNNASSSKRTKKSLRTRRAEKERRVSFGRVNHSKSYKASMNALKSMEQPSTASRSPDRSILLKKNSKREQDVDGNVVSSRKKVKHVGGTVRKKAVAYF